MCVQVEFDRLPTVMVAGEVQRAVMCVSNVGPVSLTHLAMATSDLASVVIGAHTDSNSDTTLERVVCDEGVQQPVTVSVPPLDTVIPLPISTLPPHSDISRVSVWLHAPLSVGSFNTQCMYYYEPSLPVHKMRFVL